MDEIAIIEAAMRFSEIAKRVKETGQPVRVTSLGEEIVDITPIQPHPVSRNSKDHAFLMLSQLRLDLPKQSMEDIISDIAEGRR